MTPAIAILAGALLGAFFATVAFTLLASRYQVARRIEEGSTLLADLRKTQADEQSLLTETRDLLRRQSQALEESVNREGRFEDLLSRAEVALAAGREIWGQIELQQADLAAREATLAEREAALQAREKELSHWTEDQAREAWLEELSERHRAEGERLLSAEQRRLEEERRLIGQTILVTAIQRQAIAQGLERCIEVVELPHESFKMRLVGREGRNARTFQRATGVDLVIDDTPGCVVLSSFDPLRRAVARAALTRLLQGGAIHPTRIEECVAAAQGEVDEASQRRGREVCEELHLGPIAEEMVIVIGRLDVFQSYGQNLLSHSIEVARLAGSLASELGLDAELARRAGLLHDIGRAIEHDVDLGHEEAGARFAERCGEGDRLCRMLAGHHRLGEEDPLLQVLQVADRISSQRPGARSPMIGAQVERLAKMEEAAQEMAGVEQAFAFNGGRELRVFVDAGQVSGRAATKLSRDLARQLESLGGHPGPVQVVVIREAAVEDATR